MEITLLGTRGRVDEKSKSHRFQSGVLITIGKRKILLDVGEKKFLKTNPDIIFLTHCHPDHSKGLSGEIKVPIFVHEWSTKTMKPGEFKVPFRIFKRQITLWDSVKIKAIPCQHSITCPSVGFRITYKNLSIGYFPCYLKPKVPIKKAFGGLDLVILDSAFLKKSPVRVAKKKRIRVGHTTVKEQLKWMKEAEVKNIIFIHFGSIPIRMGDRKLQNLIQELVSDIYPEANWILGKDNMSIKITKKKMERLESKFTTGVLKIPEFQEVVPKTIIETEPERAIYFIYPHSLWLWEGKKTAFVKTKKFEINPSEILYFIDNKLCYGKLVIEEPKEITLNEFKKLESEHVIDEETREKWCKKYKGWCKGPFYFYKVKVYPFTFPIPIKIPRGVQTFVDRQNIEFLDFSDLDKFKIVYFHAFAHKISNFKLHSILSKIMEEAKVYHPYIDFLDRVEEFLIKDWKTYNPMELIKTKAGRRILLDDHRIVHAWWSRLLKGKRFKSKQFEKYSLREQMRIVKELYEKIAEAMRKIGFKPKPLGNESIKLSFVDFKGLGTDEILFAWIQIDRIDFKEHTLNGRILLKDRKVPLVWKLTAVAEDYLNKYSLNKKVPIAIKCWVLSKNIVAISDVIGEQK